MYSSSRPDIEDEIALALGFALVQESTQRAVNPVLLGHVHASASVAASAPQLNVAIPRSAFVVALPVIVELPEEDDASSEVSSPCELRVDAPAARDRDGSSVSSSEASSGSSFDEEDEVGDAVRAGLGLSHSLSSVAVSVRTGNSASLDSLCSSLPWVAQTVGGASMTAPIPVPLRRGAFLSPPSK